MALIKKILNGCTVHKSEILLAKEKTKVIESIEKEAAKNGMRKIDNIVIHCSDSLFGDRNLIDRWHRQKGWRCCGYHFIICNGFVKNSSHYNIAYDGLLQHGRNIDNDPFVQFDEIGAHAHGFNTNSIGICLIGKNEFSLNQFEQLVYIIKRWKGQIPDLKVFGHYHLNQNKTCPNFDVDKFKKVCDNITVKDYLKDFVR